MCTVSFVKSGGKTIITSNRDEQLLRPAAIEPKNYRIGNKNILFPKDPKAGGTWYAVDENANVLVLLNGAAEKHAFNPPYQKSRGLIVLDLISEISIIEAWQQISLEKIEPFTLVLFESGALYQLRWDGNQKEKTVLDPELPHIWSSSTLYPENIREQREQWFRAFLDTQPAVTESEMFDFHQHTENKNTENGLVINRGNQLKTLSITQTVVQDNKVTMTHCDLVSELESAKAFLIV